MKVTSLPSFEICNKHGRELVVDLVLIESATGSREVLFYVPGTLQPADKISTGIDEFEFEHEEMDAWWEHAAMLNSQYERFLNSVSELVKADENREDTSSSAQAIREHFVDNLNRPDPLETIV